MIPYDLQFKMVYINFWQMISCTGRFVLLPIGGGVYVMGDSVSGAGKETVTPVYQQNTTFHSQDWHC